MNGLFASPGPLLSLAACVVLAGVGLVFLRLGMARLRARRLPAHLRQTSVHASATDVVFIPPYPMKIPVPQPTRDDRRP